MHMVSTSIVLASALILSPAIGFQETRVSIVNPKYEKPRWRSCSGCLVVTWIAWNSSPGTAYVPRRTIYLLIQPSDFAEQTLTGLFAKFASEFPEPQWLSITALSDEQALQKLIERRESARHLFDGTREGREAQREYYKELDLDTKAYFEASYTRVPDDEHFQYTPYPRSEKTVVVKLRDRSDRTYTGVLNTDLELAAEKGDVLKATELITQGADVNCKGPFGTTPLLKARDLRIVQLLAQKGANVNDKDDYGFTALENHAEAGRLSIVQALLDHGADANSKDMYGYTPLMVASREGHFSVVDLLLKRGADGMLTNNLKNTALMLAR